MRLVVMQTDGTVLGSIEDIERYDLRNPIDRTNLFLELHALIQAAKKGMKEEWWDE
jgi:hypothetical protein